ncbi:MAG: hypothetical protein AAF850_06975, partial [Pseudomonadota bacterium]
MKRSALIPAATFSLVVASVSLVATNARSGGSANPDEGGAGWNESFLFDSLSKPGAAPAAVRRAFAENSAMTPVGYLHDGAFCPTGRSWVPAVTLADARGALGGFYTGNAVYAADVAQPQVQASAAENPAGDEGLLQSENAGDPLANEALADASETLGDFLDEETPSVTDLLEEAGETGLYGDLPMLSMVPDLLAYNTSNAAPAGLPISGFGGGSAAGAGIGGGG